MSNENAEIIPLIFWIASILSFFINIHLATIKGRKITTWLVLTLFFGIFATIMLLLADKELENQAFKID